MATTNPPAGTGSSGDASIETLRKLKEIEAEVAGETQRVKAQATGGARPAARRCGVPGPAGEDRRRAVARGERPGRP